MRIKTTLMMLLIVIFCGNLFGQSNRKINAMLGMAPLSDVFEQLSNKYHLMQLAVALGVPIPDTVFVPNGCIDVAKLDGQSQRSDLVHRKRASDRVGQT